MVRIVFGLLAALGQAFGVMIMRPVMEGGLDPAVAGFIEQRLRSSSFTRSIPLNDIAA